MKTEPLRRGARAGVTLLELLLVMMILGVVMGGGLGLFAALDLGRRQAVGLVRNVVRTAQNTAIAGRAPARVRIDRAAGTLTAEALQVVGTWHFEDRSLRGAFGLDGESRGVEFVEDGYLGDALSFSGKTGALAEIPVQRSPSFDLSRGFSVACAVRKAPAGAGWLLRLGTVVGIRVNDAGEVEGRFATQVVEEGEPERGGDVLVRSPEGVLPPERWVRLRLEYDRVALVLFVDDVPVARVEESAPVWGIDGPLALSDEARPFTGEIDCLVVAVVVADEAGQLPDGVRLPEDAPAEVRFDAGGSLDRRLHQGPVVLRLDFDDGTSEVVTIGVYGTVE